MYGSGPGLATVQLPRDIVQGAVTSDEALHGVVQLLRRSPEPRGLGRRGGLGISRYIHVEHFWIQETQFGLSASLGQTLSKMCIYIYIS